MGCDTIYCVPLPSNLLIKRKKMDQKNYFFAVDLGATSGRTIIGNIEDGRFSLEEVTRFPNNLIEQGGHLCPLLRDDQRSEGGG